jgi:glycosyltransferase involved in cell wall biosynthesis
MNGFGQIICLVMIVKNEAHVIGRCLQSVLPVIDSWLIVDTGSSDGTPEAIRQCLRGVPGEVVERPWVDFAHNRTESLELARHKADYLLMLDADEILDLPAGYTLPRLHAACYQVEIRYGGYSYYRRQLLRGDLPWRYLGVLHEYVECPAERDTEFLRGPRIVPFHDGARARDPKTYLRDAVTLERALLDEPGNSRYVFYLAQSYRDAGEDDLAIRYYSRRARMGGWDEEVWYSLYQIARLKERLGKPWPEVCESYLAAFSFRPHRAGPLYRIGKHYQAQRQHPVAHLFLSQAIQIPFPESDTLFIERPVYDYLLPAEFAAAACRVGNYQVALAVCDAVLESGRLPADRSHALLRTRRQAVEGLQGSLRGALLLLDSAPIDALRERQSFDAVSIPALRFAEPLDQDERCRVYIEAASGPEDIVILCASSEAQNANRMAEAFHDSTAMLVLCGEAIAFRAALYRRSLDVSRSGPLRQTLARAAPENQKVTLQIGSTGVLKIGTVDYPANDRH